MKIPFLKPIKDYLGNTTTVRELPPIPDNEKLQSKNPFSDSRYASRDYDDVDLPPSPPHSDPFRNDEISDDDSHSDLKHKMKRNEKIEFVHYEGNQDFIILNYLILPW